jgi:tetratricopeptide (TPR) repeat protein
MPEDLTPTAGPLGATAALPTVTPVSPPGYELLDEVGRGGMGVVYRARDTALGRDVAVKLLSERYPPDSPAARRFLSEARITGQLQHPGIPAVHQVGAIADGRPFLAMKLIKGSTLEALLKHRPDPSADRGRLLAVFEAVCQAVGYAHAHRVIHRDLKPANVMVGAFGEVQVMDWGLAKLLGEQAPATAEALATEQTRAWTQVSPMPEAGSHTQAGSLVGTPSFIPPEQALGEIERVNERADVFGLGAVLAVILTGKPPYVGETFESVRVQAVRGKLEDCFARLDASGAEPELVALCKKCLAFEPADRPANAGAVAAAVAGLRAAADERARRAELERVRVEGEQATAQARAAERRKRRRLALGAAAVLALAALGGLLAVLAVQRRANADLAAKNADLAAEQAKVEARFELAQRAIALFHTGVSEDMLLKNAEFKQLRTTLLTEAAGFYAELERLLAGQTDAKSRKALAAAYFQLGELMDKIGDKAQALEVHRKALAVRRELAAAEGADVETRLDVARSLWAEGNLLHSAIDLTGALRAFQEQRDIATALEAESATDAVRAVLAQSHLSIGNALLDMRKPADGLQAYRKALALRQELADAHPAVAEFQRDLAQSHNSIGNALQGRGQPAAVLRAYREALAIRQKLAAVYPAVAGYQSDLAGSHYNIGMVLMGTGKPEEARQAYREALAIWQELAAVYPAVAKFQLDLAAAHNIIGSLLQQTGKPAAALLAYREALAIRQKLAAANPAVAQFQRDLAQSHFSIGDALSDRGEPEEALRANRKALAVWQKLSDANPRLPGCQRDLALAHNRLGLFLSQTGKPDEAREEYRKALAIMEKLSNANPTVPHYRINLGTFHNNLGRLLARQKRFAEAFPALDAGLAIGQKLAEADPKNTDYAIYLGFSHAYRGWALVRSAQPSRAAADLRRALVLWAKVPAPSPGTRFERSRAVALLAGLGHDAKSGVTTAEAAAFADQAVASLRDAASAGWNEPDELKEPDFDAVRGRDDFKKLVAEVEARSGPKARPKD